MDYIYKLSGFKQVLRNNVRELIKLYYDNSAVNLIEFVSFPFTTQKKTATIYVAAELS